MNVYAFDTETIDGDPFTIQFAGANGATLHRVSCETVLGVFLNFLVTHGNEETINILFAHQLEFDVGIVFATQPEIWKAHRYQLACYVGNGMPVDLDFRHSFSPHHRFTIGSQRWLLVDTMSFFKMSLARACKELLLPVKKRPRPPYLGQRAPTAEEWPAFKAYALDDARATYELAKFIIERHDEFEIRPTVSIAAMAGSIFRSRFLGGNRRGLGRTNDRVTTEHRIPFCEIEPGSDALLHAGLLSYHGGKNGLYSPPGVYHDVAEVDIVSAYPHAMTALPPLTEGHWEFVREHVPGAAGIYHVRGKVVGRCPYGVFMETATTKKIHSGVFDSWVTGWELASAWDELVLDTIEGYVWVPESGAINPFADYVAFLFDKKQCTPAQEPRRQMYKLLLNSLYGTTIQRTLDDRKDFRVAGPLFNPFWASQITGHCRARLHSLEHQYRALHASTDSILTQATQVSTGAGLGDLEIKARGRLILLRSNLWLMLDEHGRDVKAVRHAFHGTAGQLLGLARQGNNSYTVPHMVRPREALKTGQKPFRIIERSYTLRLAPKVLQHIAAELRMQGLEVR